MSGTTGQERSHTASYLGYIDATISWALLKHKKKTQKGRIYIC